MATSRTPQDRQRPSARKAAQRGHVDDDDYDDDDVVAGTIVPGSGKVRVVGTRRSVKSFPMRFANDPDDGPVYNCTPPKTAPFLNLYRTAAELPPAEAAGALAKLNEDWLFAAFPEDEAEEILARLDDPEDRGLDNDDIQALMMSVQEATTGDPTTSRRKSSKSR